MNELTNIADFRAVLADYQPSETAKKTLAEATIALLVGPSSSGRNTIINELVKTGDYYFLVSDTTRQPRLNNGVLEQDGREYWFRTEEDLLKELQRGEFVEAAIIHSQQVSGTSIREIDKARQAHKIAITEVEAVGADNIHSAKPDTIIIFVLPPSFEAWMKRLQGRGMLQPEEVRRRLESACKEFRSALQHDYYHFVINDTVEQATKDIYVITKSGTSNSAEEAHAHALLEKLLADTEAYLVFNAQN